MVSPRFHDIPMYSLHLMARSARFMSRLFQFWRPKWCHFHSIMLGPERHSLHIVGQHQQWFQESRGIKSLKADTTFRSWSLSWITKFEALEISWMSLTAPVSAKQLVSQASAPSVSSDSEICFHSCPLLTTLFHFRNCKSPLYLRLPRYGHLYSPQSVSLKVVHLQVVIDGGQRCWHTPGKFKTNY